MDFEIVDKSLHSIDDSERNSVYTGDFYAFNIKNIKTLLLYFLQYKINFFVMYDNNMLV